MGVRVDNIDWKDLLFGFDGRINRAKYWAGTVVVWAIYTIWMILMFVAIAMSSTALVAIVSLLGFAVIVITVWAGLAVSIKRWHDRGKSGWWILIVFVPIIGSIWALIETGFLEGDPGDNQYGPNPLAS
jgi:uncharacterized membrane protein YhaH (DUF805 family)